MNVSKSGGPVAVVGSLHHDIVVQADRQPLRGETLMGHKWFPKFGGKGGNQAAAAARLGAKTHMIGAVGQDSFGDDLIAGLDSAGVDRTAVERVKTGSGMSVAIVDAEGDYSAVVVTGANAEINQETVATSSVMDRASVLLLQNEVPLVINQIAAAKAQQAGASVLWNAAPMRPDPEAFVKMVDLLIVNAVEAEQLCGQKVGSLQEAERAAFKLRDLGVSTVVTAGAAGCAWATLEGETGSLPAVAVAQGQAHGAGDVFCGALAAHLINAPLSQSIEFASAAAHRHVSGLKLV